MYKNDVEIGFSESFSTYCNEAVIQKSIAEKLARLMDRYIDAKPKCGVEVGCGSGFLTKELIRRYGCENWLYNDISPKSKEYVEQIAMDFGNTPNFVVGDAEHICYPDSIDVLASSSAIQWFTDVPSFFARVGGKISDNGVLAVSTFGPDNFCEIRTATGNGLKYLSLNELRVLFEPHFELLEAEEEHRKLYFDSPMDVLRHIKQTGVNGCFRQSWTKAKLNAFCDAYEQFRCGKGVSLTYHPIYVLAKKRENIHLN